MFLVQAHFWDVDVWAIARSRSGCVPSRGASGKPLKSIDASSSYAGTSEVKHLTLAISFPYSKNPQQTIEMLGLNDSQSL